MSMMSYLLIVLGLSAVIYAVYRLTFLKSDKKGITSKPNFTLKIEIE
ncbi:MAG: hypothetical protein PHO27_00130 [Sulfuricurvum sp.]|nr:hypothetical protein [Sulfuricurvum sp.]